MKGQGWVLGHPEGHLCHILTLPSKVTDVNSCDQSKSDGGFSTDAPGHPKESSPTTVNPPDTLPTPERPQYFTAEQVHEGTSKCVNNPLPLGHVPQMEPTVQGAGCAPPWTQTPAHAQSCPPELGASMDVVFVHSLHHLLSWAGIGPHFMSLETEVQEGALCSPRPAPLVWPRGTPTPCLHTAPLSLSHFSFKAQLPAS